MIPELCFIGVTAAMGAWGIYDKIKYKEHKGYSYTDDVVKEFNKFVNRCKNKETARVVFFLPVVEGGNEFSFLHGVEIKGNEEAIKEALITKDFAKIIHKKHIDFNYIKINGFKFESIPYSNRFMINFYND